MTLGDKASNTRKRSAQQFLKKLYVSTRVLSSLKAILGSLGAFLGALGAILGQYWARPGTSSAILRPLGTMLESSWLP